VPYPPSPPPVGRTDSTPLPTNHPDDHNAISAALTDIINELGSNPKGTQASVTAHFAVVCPVGAVLPYAGASAPANWALCDGSEQLRTHPLFSVIGTTYGIGNGTTTFNVPDLRSRFVAGKGVATWSDTLNESGGSKDTTLVDHQHAGPIHSHIQQGTFTSTPAGAHTHNFGAGFGFLYNDPGLPGGWTISGTGTINLTGGYQHAVDHQHNVTISGSTQNNTAGNTTGNTATTGSATDTNLPPYLTLNHIIRLG
jgi:microcystin-dependent protein